MLKMRGVDEGCAELMAEGTGDDLWVKLRFHLRVMQQQCCSWCLLLATALSLKNLRTFAHRGIFNCR